ncbi:hypothetical protein ABMA27_014504 [Loxostege sticticalis]|uniref:Uncharacterized protein n=1 Tax=Loxostege sticticalis TaxID=481309 RepID=A0ABR3I9A5_LOXSC
MKNLPGCRICLSTKASKDISNLKSQDSDKTGFDILLFCLSIQVETDSKVTTKLCIKCFRKIIVFFDFKLLALKSDAYLKDLESYGHIKSETLVDKDLKHEELISESNVSEIPVVDIKLEPTNNEEVGDIPSESEDELLSDVRRIKYEFIPEEIETETNGHLKKNEEKTEQGEKPKTQLQVCGECGKRVKDLRNHMQRHKPKVVAKRVPCPLCDKTFASYHSKSKHIKRIHLGVKSTCPTCNKEVKNVKLHILRVHTPSQLRYECAACGRRFVSASVRDTHMLTHTKDRPHACDQCGKRFRQLVNLVQHKQQIHDRKETHLCQYCSKSFFTAKYLQRHLRSHSSDRPYKCKQCDKAFKTSKVLKNHIYTHSRERTFRCTVCDMGFVHPGYLRAHMLTHTREKQFPCKYCGVNFHRSDHRKRHQYTAHEKLLSS